MDLLPRTTVPYTVPYGHDMSRLVGGTLNWLVSGMPAGKGGSQAAMDKTRGWGTLVASGLLLASGALLVMQGCDSRPEQTSITREEYIDLYVDVLLVAAEERDSTKASDRAAQIIEQRGYTSDDLQQFADSYADDPTYLTDVWREIEMRLQQPEPFDTTDSG